MFVHAHVDKDGDIVAAWKDRVLLHYAKACCVFPDPETMPQRPTAKCLSRNPIGTYICTLPEGHRGIHVGGTSVPLRSAGDAWDDNGNSVLKSRTGPAALTADTLDPVASLGAKLGALRGGKS